jgi:hypothetical protein
MKTYFVDTETCGFHGVPITIQWAIDDGPVHLHHIWDESIEKTMLRIEGMVNNRVVAHNLRFDWFHLSKLYNMLQWALDELGPESRTMTPLELAGVGFWADAEWNSQFGPCLKPAAAVDTLLCASKGQYQSSLMDAKPVWIRRVPIGVVNDLMVLLETEAQKLPWILFAKRARPDDPRWSASDCHDLEGNYDPGFKDLKLSFRPSKSLKHLAAFLCEHNVEHKYEDIAFATQPIEEGYAPFVNLLTNDEQHWLYEGKPTWPLLLQEHVNHWQMDTDAQEYAEDDITMLRKLYEYFGSPQNDEDAIVACQVASCRLRGFDVDMDGVRRELEKSLKIVGTARLNVDSPKQVLEYVGQAMDSMEALCLADGCDKKVIDKIKLECNLDEREECSCVASGDEEDDEDYGDLDLDDECSTTIIDGVCQRCNGLGSVGPGPMPVVERVEHINLIRKHRKRVQLFDKLILAKRAYPDFNVIGTKSGRMSGAGGLNFQGVDHSPEVRGLFTLADEGWVLSAGDYAGQELGIAVTTMQDQDLMRDMMTGRKFHADFAAELFGTTYEDIMESYEQHGDERYGKGKSAVFLTLYGGTYKTLAENCGITEEQAEKGYNRILQKYPQIGATKKMITDRFSAILRTPEGKMDYREVEEPWIESVFGYRRYFHTEYGIQRSIWDLMKNLPPHWKEKFTVVKKWANGTPSHREEIKVNRDRKDPTRFQTITGAIFSAMSGSCYSIQNQIIRASNNHVIQSTARTMTVGMQHELWTLQPTGIHPFRISLMSVHDELAVVTKEHTVPDVLKKLEAKVAEQRKVIPLTSIEWFTGNKSWAEKGHGEEGRVIGWNLKEELTDGTLH